MRIHSSINFDEAYEARPEEFREKDEETGKTLTDDILWVRIESEPILHYPDLLTSEAKTKYISYINGKNVGVTGLNSVNQIIINVNADNTDSNSRPVVIFYDGPETNDVYSDYAARTDVLHRKSLPVILNLNKPFRGVLYAPNSPVVIIGDYKDYFQGFVVASDYYRLKDDDDFILGDEEHYTDYTRKTENDSGSYSIPVYYSKSDGTTCYKITDENGIEMYVDKKHGDIQFKKFTSSPASYGRYDNFGRTYFSTHGYEVKKYSASNMLIWEDPNSKGIYPVVESSN